MNTINDLQAYRKKCASGTLTVDGKNVCELAAENPTAAYDLVFKEVEARGGFKAFHAHRERQSCIGAAMAKPLPGAAGDAYTKGPVNAAGRKVNKVTCAIWALLQAVESPIIVMFQQAAKTGEAKAEWSESQKWDACWIFTESAHRLYDLLESDGPKAVQAECRSHVMDWEQSEIDVVMTGIMEQIRRHSNTLVKHLTEAKEGGEINFFVERAETPASQ